MNHNQASILDYEEVARMLYTDLLAGLSPFEARERLKKYGQNSLAPASDSTTAASRAAKCVGQNLAAFLRQFLNPLIQLLMLCALISALIGEYENAISVALAILIVCVISYAQERRADRSLERLNRQMPSMSTVLREGQKLEMESRYLVPGDIIYLTEGQRVPADVRLFECHSMTVNEANLTGETQAQIKVVEPLKKRLASVLSGQTNLMDDKYFIYQNLAMMGTTVEQGHSKGIVVLTGRLTRYGQVYSMLKSTVQPRSPLQRNIDQLSIHQVVISCIVIAAISIVGILQQRKPLDVAYYALSLAVTAIPEGLPVVVAVIMALSVLRLSKQKTIVKSLNSIETLGCIQVLCLDKTGTLTRHDMTLTDIVTSELYSVSSGELEELNNEECRKHMTFNKFGGKLHSIGRLLEAGTLCNNASVDPTPSNPALPYIGQATDCAILDAALRMGFGDSRTKFDRIHEVPFQASRRQMAVKCRRLDSPSQSPMHYVKGAWEDILKDCTHYYENGLVKPRNEETWAEYERVSKILCAQGLRVLALASGASMDQLAFIGLVGINNALRDEIGATLTSLRQNYFIEAKMITGDAKATAMAVARSLGLIAGPSEADDERVVMSGDECRRLLESDLDELAKAQEINSKTVFYRVDPLQKADIVRKLQELDRVVAMTGDGVNDVISMKLANLSLVMGSGADVCKEVADVILVEDDLSVLVPAVEEGRSIYKKIHSFMSYQISISLTLVCLTGFAFAARLDPPFTVLQLLFLNILADGPPAQILGAERVPACELNQKPRDVHQPILNCQLLTTTTALTSILIFFNGTLYYLMLDHQNHLDSHARTFLFTCFVVSSIVVTLALKCYAYCKRRWAS